MIIFSCLLALLPWTLPKISFNKTRLLKAGLQEKIAQYLTSSPKIDSAHLMQQIAVRLESGISLEQAYKETFPKPTSFEKSSKSTIRTNNTAREQKIYLRSQRNHQQKLKTLNYTHKNHHDMTTIMPDLDKILKYAQSLGAPLAQVLTAGAKALIEVEKTAYSCKEALAGPKTSAKILAILPFFALALGSTLGAKPTEVFTDLKYGTLSLLVGVLALSLGWFWSGKILKAAEKENFASVSSGIDPAVAIDLANAGLRVGAGIIPILTALGESSDDREIVMVAKALRGGVDWEAAWENRSSSLAKEIEQALAPAWLEGVNPEILLQQQGEKIRYARESKAREAAQRLGVKLVLPLGLCMLPAFICLGVVPLIISGINF